MKAGGGHLKHIFNWKKYTSIMIKCAIKQQKWMKTLKTIALNFLRYFINVLYIYTYTYTYLYIHAHTYMYEYV